MTMNMNEFEYEERRNLQSRRQLQGSHNVSDWNNKDADDDENHYGSSCRGSFVTKKNEVKAESLFRTRKNRD